MRSLGFVLEPVAPERSDARDPGGLGLEAEHVHDRKTA